MIALNRICLAGLVVATIGCQSKMTTVQPSAPTVQPPPAKCEMPTMQLVECYDKHVLVFKAYVTSIVDLKCHSKLKCKVKQ